jgi:magnesium chelatase subunit I
MASTFPFAAIVGQDEMTLAIQVVAIDPTVGGVLVLAALALNEAATWRVTNE